MPNPGSPNVEHAVEQHGSFSPLGVSSSSLSPLHFSHCTQFVPACVTCQIHKENDEPLLVRGSAKDPLLCLTVVHCTGSQRARRRLSAFSHTADPRESCRSSWISCVDGAQSSTTTDFVCVTAFDCVAASSVSQCYGRFKWKAETKELEQKQLSYRWAHQVLTTRVLRMPKTHQLFY